ncbi:hypothetical protein C8Q74DRAFT_1369210 [Fomes fomentarius]|nr:hypothetical protein C8Q74DRAFT_1369210 [Fomes fomentarius]
MSISEPIVFYDIPGNAAKDKAWSPNTWKTRYSLNIKGISYKTVWVEFPDIAALCKKIGAPHTSTKPDGSLHYTLPVIYDPNTKTAVSESAAIARYLDKTYPSTFALIPKETDALHEAFTQAFRAAFLVNVAMIILAPTCAQLSPRAAEYFRQAREAMFNDKMEAFAPAGSEKRARHWKGVQDALHMVKGWLAADGSEKLFFMDDRVLYADITVAAWLQSVKRVLGDDSREWKDLTQWDGGHWARFMREFEKYEAVDVGSDAEL